MKKTVFPAFLVACFFLCAFCGPKGDPRPLTPEDEADTIRMSLGYIRIKSEVSARDVDGNGGIDFYILITNLSKKPSPNRRKILLSYITGAVSANSEKIVWESDKVYVEVLEEVYMAKIGDCVTCVNKGRKEIDSCVEEAWQKIE